MYFCYLLSYSLFLAEPSVPPQTLQGVAINSTTISLSWEPPPPEQWNGILREYLIRVTEVEGGHTLQFSTPNTTFVVSSLHPFYTYLCSVSAVTVEPGPFSSEVPVTTHEAGLCCKLTCLSIVLSIFLIIPFDAAPYGPPRDFSITVLSPRSIFLSWSAPLFELQNGDITGYIIDIMVMQTGQSFQVSAEGTNITIGSINPYSSYVCHIAAQTSVGIGPFSNTVVIMTPEDGKTGVLI